MAFETAAAKVQWSIEKRRESRRTTIRAPRPQLLAYAPGFPWQEFLEAQQLGSRQDLGARGADAIRDLAALFNRTPLPTLQGLSHLPLPQQPRPCCLSASTRRASTSTADLRGQPQQRERWKRGVDAVDGALGEAVGRLYVAKYFPPESKAKMQQLVANLEAALGQRIDALDWMTPETKTRAHEKLAAFTPKIGYPDKWKDYSALVIRRDDPLGNNAARRRVGMELPARAARQAG